MYMCMDKWLHTNRLLTHNEVKLKLADRMFLRLNSGMPANLIIWLKDLKKLKITVDFDTQQKTNLQKNTLEGANT